MIEDEEGDEITETGKGEADKERMEHRMARELSTVYVFLAVKKKNSAASVPALRE